MSTLQARPALPFIQTLIPALLLAGLTGAVVHQAGFLAGPPAEAALYAPQTVTIEPRQFSYRADGEYLRGSHVIDAPMATVDEKRPLTIMKYQVAHSDYDHCVADGACKAAEGVHPVRENMPVTGVSHDDAQAYAAWLSQRTGETWSLPTDEQLAFAAGTGFPDDAFGLDPDNRNPALRWLADYKREAAERSKRDPVPRIRGSFGENEFGLADFGGNIWEWTATCHRRVQVDGEGTVLRDEPSCGVYVTVGNHRSPMTSFVRDPKGGGCAVGTPPDNLGFRLVKSTRWYAPLISRLRDSGFPV